MSQETHKNSFFYVTLNLIMPIVIGGIVYAYCRGSNFLYIQWLDRIGINLTGLQLCDADSLPAEWLMYSVPDGLYLYSAANFLIIWNPLRLRSYSIIYPSISAFILIVSELMQLMRLIPGTFDIVDIAMYLVAAFASYKLNSAES